MARCGSTCRTANAIPRSRPISHRYYDEWLLADELGFDIMLNEHHQTATCMSSTVVVALSVLARQTKRARLLVLGYPIGHRPDPLRAAEELATIDVSRAAVSTWASSRACPTSFPCSNQNPVVVMDKFWEAHDFIVKAMTSHDEPFNWEGEFFHYRHVNIWPRPWQQPHPPIWSAAGSPANARMLGEQRLRDGGARHRLQDQAAVRCLSRGLYVEGPSGAGPGPLRLSGLVAVAPDEAKARRGELVASYLRSSSIVARAVPQSARLSLGRGQMPAP